mgnify:FL=1
MIDLVRVDFRMIHGQVITQWVKKFSTQYIIAVDDELAEDDFMQEVYKMAAPRGVKVKILSIAKAVEKKSAGDFDTKNTLVLFRTVAALSEAIKAGFDVKIIQIGGLGGGPGRKAVSNAITLDQKDADELQEIANKGIEVYFQTTPDYPKDTLADCIAKLNK